MKSEAKVQSLLRAPWTVQATAAEEDPSHVVLRIRELPEFVVVGPRDEALIGEFWTALESLLQAYVEEGQDPPLPEGYRELWARLSGSVTVVGDVATAKSSGAAVGTDRLELVGAGGGRAA